jgi:alanine racemase
MLPPSQRQTWASISRSALRHNFRAVKRHVGEAIEVMAIVKADAYGHGAIECAREFEAAGATWFGVALVEEGIALRQAGINHPILCLTGVTAHQAEAVLAHDLSVVVYDLESVEALDAAERATGGIATIHIKVDTGLGRLGVLPAHLAEFGKAVSRFNNVRVEGLLTHFAEANVSSSEFTSAQIATFHEARKILEEAGVSPPFMHLANSAAIHAHPQAWGNLVRAGGLLYGLVKDVLASTPDPLDVRPVMSLHSRVAYLKTVPAGESLGYGRTFTTSRESRIATIPVGYADGLRRALSNNGRALLRGVSAPIVGRVSMDLTLIDVTDIPEAAAGDHVTLIGPSGDQRIRAEDVAEAAGTISYEVVCGIGRRVPREYVD